MTTPRVLMLDHRDSFVFNLVDDLQGLGAEVRTVRGGLELEALQAEVAGYVPHLVVLSPGPGHPEDAGVMVPWLGTEPEVAVLGVCLGHQAIAVACGGKLARAPRPVHGQVDAVALREDPLFAGLPNPLVAARYHSLVVDELPGTLQVLATLQDPHDGELVMALRHRQRPWYGVQFHPESILTTHGRRLLCNALRLACPVPNPSTASSSRASES